jgi:hypothetical protein
MPAHAVLIPAALGAARATEVLARYTGSSQRLRQLTVADHRAALSAFAELSAETTGGHSLLSAAAGLAAAHAPRPLDYHGYTALDIHAGIEQAMKEAAAADVAPAVTALRTTIRQLEAERHQHAQVRPPQRNRLAVAIRRVAVMVGELARAIPVDGSTADLDWALRGACDIVHALNLTCRAEATLIDTAYSGAGIGRSAATVTDTLTSGASALRRACGTLIAAQCYAQQEAHRLQTA